MAFELPNLPNFNVQPIQTPNPLDTYGKALQLKALMGQQQLLPLQVEQEQEKARQAQIQTTTQELQLKTMQGVNKYWSNPDQFAPTDEEASGGFGPVSKALPQGVHPDRLASLLGVESSDPIMTQIRGMMKAGVPFPGAIAEAQNTLAFRKNVYALGEEQQKMLGTSLDKLKSIAAPILAETDANKKQTLLDQAKPGLMEWGSFDPSIGQVVPSLNAGNFDAFANRLGAEADALAVGKAKAEKTAAEQKIVPPGGMSQEQAGEAAKTIAVETNPQVQAGKVAVAKAEATAREQVQAQMLPLLEQIRQQFGNQKDARDKIESTVLKPYQDKMTDIQMARSAISQAQDNPVAARAAIFKMVGVAQPTGSHRVLPMEFTAFKYPGGITDQVRQKFNDFLTGEPWTPEIAQAANAFIDAQQGAQQKQLGAGIDNVNSLYGTSVGQGLKPQKNFFQNFGGTQR